MNLIHVRITRTDVPIPIYVCTFDPRGPSISIGSRGQLFVSGANENIEPPYNIEVSVTPFDKPCAEGK